MFASVKIYRNGPKIKSDTKIFHLVPSYSEPYWKFFCSDEQITALYIYAVVDLVQTTVLIIFSHFKSNTTLQDEFFSAWKVQVLLAYNWHDCTACSSQIPCGIYCGTETCYREQSIHYAQFSLFNTGWFDRRQMCRYVRYLLKQVVAILYSCYIAKCFSHIEKSTVRQWNSKVLLL